MLCPYSTMDEFTIPYGKTQLTFTLPDSLSVEVIAPADAPPAPNPVRAVEQALDVWPQWSEHRGARSAAVAISDKTRPVPHEVLLPPLLERLEMRLGLPPEKITLVIATGSHVPMPPETFAGVVPKTILNRYPVICHDCDDTDNLRYLGETSRGTPVWINRRFVEADFRVVVGNIEPHQFMGFSGGAKSAAIGLAGRETINRNHAMMLHPDARLGHYDDNPMRQDVEEIGGMAGIQLALNAVLNRKKQVVHAIAGEPRAVMEMGIPLAREICQVKVGAPFDLMIASPGGHPKDINLYQGQKALGHAALVTKPGGAVILAAACPEGTGSQSYEQWMFALETNSYEDVFARFERFAREGFCVGPHKAYQIARDAVRVRLLFVSEMPPDFVQRLLLTPAASLEDALARVLPNLPPGARVGVMPAANATVPLLAETA